MKVRTLPLDKLRKDRRAISPAISTVILTSAVVVMLLVVIVFANNFLNARMAENEFSTVKQFMQTVGLQIDDVAWTVGRTQTVRYASNYGTVDFESVTLNYTIYVNKTGQYVAFANYTVGILLFNMYVSQYTLGNNYYERIFPSSDSSFLQKGTSAPVSYVYVIEKLPMDDGNFIRVVVAPCIRMLNSTISSDTGGTKNYFKFYLPLLEQGANPRFSQSITLVGSSVSVKTETCNSIKIDVTFPKASLGFDANFFKFNNTEEIVDVPDGSTVEFYTSEVIVSLGLNA